MPDRLAIDNRKQCVIRWTTPDTALFPASKLDTTPYGAERRSRTGQGVSGEGEQQVRESEESLNPMPTAPLKRRRRLFAVGSFALFAAAFLASVTSPASSAPDAPAGQGFLPNNRAWELVSPQDKNGGDIGSDTSRSRAARDGDAVQFVSLSVFAGAMGTGTAVDYVARRDATPGTQGWSTHAITPLQDARATVDTTFGADARYSGLSSDLSKGVFFATSPVTAGSPNVAELKNLYLRDDILAPGAGSYALLTDCLTPPLGPCSSPLVYQPLPYHESAFADASDDYGHILFESVENLTTDASGADPKLYEWDHGAVRLGGILPDGTPAPSSAAGRGSGTSALIRAYTENTISADGSRIVFTSPVNSDSQGTESADLFIREDGATTVQVNAEERTLAPDPPDDGKAEFWTASADLTKIFFTSTEQLTDDDDDGNSLDLFRYDASLPPSDPHNLTRIGIDEELDDGTYSDVTGVVGAGDDGEYVYFLSRNQLIDDGVTGDTVSPCPSDITCIFVWHDGEMHQVSRVRTGQGVNALRGSDQWTTTATSRKAARVTPDGQQLVFVSEGTPDEQPAYDHGTAC
jgi:WD40-like Beta Propeller Repeat